MGKTLASGVGGGESHLRFSLGLTGVPEGSAGAGAGAGAGMSGGAGRGGHSLALRRSAALAAVNTTDDEYGAVGRPRLHHLSHFCHFCECTD